MTKGKSDTKRFTRLITIENNPKKMRLIATNLSLLLKNVVTKTEAK